MSDSLLVGILPISPSSLSHSVGHKGRCYTTCMIDRGSHDVRVQTAEERMSDLIWLDRHLPLFEQIGRSAYPILGRGAVVIDATVRSVWGQHPLGYLPLADVERNGVRESISLAHGYDPDQEIVVMIVKQQGHANVYRLNATYQSVRAGGDV